MHYFIGIDPGVNTGYAILNENECVALGLVHNKNQFAQSEAVLNRAWQYLNGAHDADRVFVAIEYPQIYPHMPVPADDILNIAKLCGMIAYSFRSTMYAVPYFLEDPAFIRPAEWKGQVPKDIHNARILNRDPNVRHMLEMSPHIPRGKWEHVIDAAGLAMYARKQVMR